MADRHTLLRSLHDFGLDAWFGGSLMGVVGLNGGTAKAKDSAERLRLSAIGWGRWAPVQLGAIISYGVGSIGLFVTDTTRQAAQREARTNSLLTIGFTALAGGASLAAGLAGLTLSRHADEGTIGVTEPAGGASDQLKRAQSTLKVTQWLIPLFTGVLVVLHAQQGELQRPSGLVGSLGRTAKRVIAR